MNPVLLDLGPLQVHWYGLLIVFGAVLAAWISTKRPHAAVRTPNTSGTC